MDEPHVSVYTDRYRPCDGEFRPGDDGDVILLHLSYVVDGETVAALHKDLTLDDARELAGRLLWLCSLEGDGDG